METRDIDFSGVTLPFSVGDMLAVAMDLVTLVGPFVLLGLAFLFAPKVWGLIFNASSRGSKR